MPKKKKKSFLKSFLARLDVFRYYVRISGVAKIARRYFVMNAFDGALTIFGVVVGSYAARISDPVLLLTVSMTTCLAIGLSGLWGAYLTEAAERKRELEELERIMLVDLEKTDIAVSKKFAVYATAAVDGVSPVLAGVTLAFPFLLAFYSVIPMATAYQASFVLAFLVFFSLGIFLGRVSQENLILSGVKMVLAGAICALAGWLISMAG